MNTITITIKTEYERVRKEVLCDLRTLLMKYPTAKWKVAQKSEQEYNGDDLTFPLDLHLFKAQSEPASTPLEQAMNEVIDGKDFQDQMRPKEGEGVESVELSHNGRTVRLAPNETGDAA